MALTHDRGGSRRGADPVPIDLDLDPEIHLSPYTLYRWLSEGRRLLLADVRPRPQGGAPPERTLLGAEIVPGPDWTPPAGLPVILFDDDGRTAAPLARRLRTAGHGQVHALFGGLELYDYALDPQVVGEERCLIRTPSQPPGLPRTPS